MPHTPLTGSTSVKVTERDEFRCPYGTILEIYINIVSLKVGKGRSRLKTLGLRST